MNQRTPKTPYSLRATTVPLACLIAVAAYVLLADLPPRSAIVSAAEEAAKSPLADPAPLFSNWTKPEFVLFLTGRQQGYIEPCGCTGLENQKGGLMRRHTLLKEMRQKGWDVVPLDIGNQVRRFGRQAEIKYQTTIDSLRIMDYRAIAFGPDDLRLSIGELIAVLAGDGSGKGPLVAANVNLLDMTKRFEIVQAGNRKIGVTSVLSKEFQQNITSDEIELTDPIPALRAVVQQMKNEHCDWLVLLAHASLEDSRSIAAQFPELDLVVTAGGAGEPTLAPEQLPNQKTQMVQVGTKGAYAGAVGFFPGNSPPLRYERIPLDDRFVDSPEMTEVFSGYQQQLEDLGLEGLGLRPLPHPSGHDFVGSQTCAECHTSAAEVYETTPHHHATDSISQPTQRATIPRHHDPECLSCHVTGWNPQQFFPYKSGYLSLNGTENMHGNGCENCHGPGSRHVAVELGDVEVSDEVRSQLREQMRLTVEEAKNNACYQCHDLDNSPDFQLEGAFEKYWKQIEHHGKD